MNDIFPFYQLRFQKYLSKRDISSVWNQGLEDRTIHFNANYELSQIRNDLKSLKQQTYKLNEGKVTSNIMMGYIHEYIIYKRRLGEIQKVKVDKQHWIPECYLKGFADKIEPNDMYRISKFSTIDNTISLVALSEFSTTKKEQNLYDYELEKFFSLMETDYSEVMSNLKEGADATVWERIVLSTFFATLSFRTKFIIEKMNLDSHNFFVALFSFIEDFALGETVLMKFPNTSLLFTQSPVQIVYMTKEIYGFYVPLKRGLCLVFLPFIKGKRLSSNSYQDLFMVAFNDNIKRARSLGNLSHLYCNPNDPFFISSQEINSSDPQIPYLLKTPLAKWYEDYPKPFRDHRKVNILSA